jgi:hypothetical protein
MVLLQDRVDHIEGAVESCRKALTMTLIVLLLRNPPPESVQGLLEAFGSSRNIHRLVKLQHLAGAQFALAWVRKWKKKLDFDKISKGFPPRKSKGIHLKKHLEATLEPAKRMIDRLLEADAGYFEEHHYLEPIILEPIRGQNPM